MCAQVTKGTSWVDIVEANPWLRSTKLVVKPDMLFGKRGKHDLVGLNLDASEAEAFIQQRMGKVCLAAGGWHAAACGRHTSPGGCPARRAAPTHTRWRSRRQAAQVIDMSGCVGAITTFIVEPFQPHDQEFYLSIQSKRLGCIISFSEAGGVEIEENWDRVGAGRGACLVSGQAGRPSAGQPRRHQAAHSGKRASPGRQACGAASPSLTAQPARLCQAARLSGTPTLQKTSRTCTPPPAGWCRSGRCTCPRAQRWTRTCWRQLCPACL